MQNMIDSLSVLLCRHLAILLIVSVFAASICLELIFNFSGYAAANDLIPQFDGKTIKKICWLVLWLIISIFSIAERVRPWVLTAELIIPVIVIIFFIKVRIDENKN